MEPITEFSGEYRWLSNFYKAPIVINDMRFPAAEHAYQAAKSLDPRDWRDCASCLLPGAVKRLGEILPLRPDWEEIKLHVMAEIVTLKFDQNPELKDKLLATAGRELINGIGENHLGKILMAYRDNTKENRP